MKALKLFLICGFFIISVNAFSKIDVPPHPDSLNKIKEKVIANAPILEKIIDSDVPIDTKKERIFDWITKYLPTTNDRGDINNYKIEPTTINNRIVLKALNTAKFSKIAEVSGSLENNFYYEYVYLSYTLVIDLKDTKYRVRFEQVNYTTNTFCPFRLGKLGSGTSSHWLVDEKWRSSPKLISQESFISKYNWYKKVYDDPNSFTKKKNLRERCLLSAYCDYYNELMEYDAVSLILNIVYRGITANVEAGPKESSVNAVDDLNF